MQTDKGTDRVAHNRHLVLVDGISILISIYASLLIRFGTLSIAPYLARIRLAILLLVFFRLSLFALFGLYRVVRRPWSLRQIPLLIGSVILSSCLTALLVLGLGLPLGLVDWFPRSLLIIELLPGIILSGAARIGQRLWDTTITSKSEDELQAIRSRLRLIIGMLFIALMAVLSWQALSLAAALLPGDWTSFLAGIPIIVLSAILFLLPGYTLLALLRPRMGLNPLEGLIASAGLSVAVVPLLLYFCSLAGLKLNKVSVGTFFVIFGALALWRSLPRIRAAISAARLRRPERQRPPYLQRARSLLAGDIAEGHIFYATLAMIFLMALLVRLWVVKDLAVGMWADSYHHTMISQLLVDNGGLFRSWEPYAPLSSFTYHFGFHSLVAFCHWLTGVPVTKSVLLVGQIINSLAVPLMYLLTRQLTGSRWAGLTAALIVGFLSSMPMYYVNWGRYTQLAGQTILPVLMLLSVESRLGKERDWRVLVLAIVGLAGLILTHYRVTWMYLWFLPVVLLYRTYRSVKNREKRSAVQAWLSISVVVAAASVMVSPWVWNLRQGSLLSMGLGNLTSEGSLSGVTYIEQLVATGDIFRFLEGRVLVLSLLGAALAVIERRKDPVIVSGWIAVLLFLAAYSHILPVPDWPQENIFTLMLALYIPASVLSGSFLSRLLHVARAKESWVMLVAANAGLFVVVLAHRDMLRIVASDNILVTSADEKAMDWISKHTSEEAKFLVNFHFEYEGSLVLGSDAGWWIPVLAGRQNTIPPMTYGGEASFDPDYLDKVNAFARAIQHAEFSDAATCRLLNNNGVTHVFIGYKGGTLQPASFLDNPCYQSVYHEDGVWIFEVTQAGS